MVSQYLSSVKNESRLPFKGILAIVALGIALLGAIILPSNLFEHLDAQHILVVQSPFSGALTIHASPGVKWQGWGKITTYLKRDQYSFEDTDKSAIKIRFNDGGHGDASGGVAWEMPTDTDRLLNLHAKYGDQDRIERDLVRTVVQKSIYMTGPLMTSKESSAERRNYMITAIEDQIQGGIYQTRTEQIKEPDPMTGTMKTVNIVKLVLDDKGIPKRQESSPLTDFGINVFNLSINGIKYDDTVEAQIQEQQKAIMQVQTAVANAKKAEQDAITVAKLGEAEAAAAKWKQEALKATAVTEAEQKLAVAELDKRTAEQRKQENILIGQGEAERRRLVMQADGALKQKLDVYQAVNARYAQAIENIKQPIVPAVVMGQGAGGPHQTGVQTLIDAITVKTARELALTVTEEK